MIKLARLIIISLAFSGCGKIDSTAIGAMSSDHVSVTATPMASLSNTYWKLIRLHGKDVFMAKQQTREAYLQLKTADHSVKGFGSCNSLRGSFKVDGHSLTFGPILTTRKSCVSVMGVESAFTGALADTNYYRINENNLTLLNRAKQSIAHFKAQYFN
jgi:putative lipoprotein